MRGLLARLLRYLAIRHNRCVGLWRRFVYPDPETYAEYVRRHGGLLAMGEHCAIDPRTVFTDPAYTRIGDNVRIAGAWLLGHDGSVNMLNRAFNLRLDKVGKVDIRDDVFIGLNAIVMPGVTIGPRSVVAAGSVVVKDVLPDTVVGGVPAKAICSIQDLVDRLQAQTNDLPWADLIRQRGGRGFDPALEPELRRLRVQSFYGGGENLTLGT